MPYADPVKRAAYQAAYRAAHRDKALIYFRAYYAAHREQLLADVRDYRLRNADAYRLSKSKHYFANREAALARVKKWQMSNPEKARQNKRIYKDRARGADGSHSVEELTALRAAQNDCCANPDCGVPLNGGGHRDHIKPISKGGTNWIANIQFLCRPCNQHKAAKYTD